MIKSLNIYQGIWIFLLYIHPRNVHELQRPTCQPRSNMQSQEETLRGLLLNSQKECITEACPRETQCLLSAFPSPGPQALRSQVLLRSFVCLLFWLLTGVVTTMHDSLFTVLTALFPKWTDIWVVLWLIPRDFSFLRLNR